VAAAAQKVSKSLEDIREQTERAQQTLTGLAGPIARQWQQLAELRKELDREPRVIGILQTLAVAWSRIAPGAARFLSDQAEAARVLESSRKATLEMAIAFQQQAIAKAREELVERRTLQLANERLKIERQIREEREAALKLLAELKPQLELDVAGARRGIVPIAQLLPRRDEARAVVEDFLGRPGRRELMAQLAQQGLPLVPVPVPPIRPRIFQVTGPAELAIAEELRREQERAEMMAALRAIVEDSTQNEQRRAAATRLLVALQDQATASTRRAAMAHMQLAQTMTAAGNVAVGLITALRSRSAGGILQAAGGFVGLLPGGQIAGAVLGTLGVTISALTQRSAAPVPVYDAAVARKLDTLTEEIRERLVSVTIGPHTFAGPDADRVLYEIYRSNRLRGTPRIPGG
jgi:hypothetical protein